VIAATAGHTLIINILHLAAIAAADMVIMIPAAAITTAKFSSKYIEFKQARKDDIPSPIKRRGNFRQFWLNKIPSLEGIFILKLV
jgi:hypothetical protein